MKHVNVRPANRRWSDAGKSSVGAQHCEVLSGTLVPAVSNSEAHTTKPLCKVVEHRSNAVPHTTTTTAIIIIITVNIRYYGVL
jgi:hypothetical protein